ncbi:MAG: OsmC family protein [Acidimicrobiales bacterium]
MAQSSSRTDQATRVSLELETGYRFRVDLGEGFSPLVMDEPEPLGSGSGPNASRVLAAAVGNCLSASLLYCLRRARIEVKSLKTEVEVTSVRNQAGRLRIGGMRVVLAPEITSEGADARFDRCLKLFEDFCVVTESVRGGFDVEVAVSRR